MSFPVVLDNTVLVNFASAERPDLVLQAWPDAVCTTPEVQTEFQRGVEGGGLPEMPWSRLPVTDLTEKEARFARELAPRFGAGERSCLAVAFHRGGLFASDDADARQEAQQLDVPVTGTIGILARVVNEGLISMEEANVLLTRMIEAGYHSPIQRINDLL